MKFKRFKKFIQPIRDGNSIKVQLDSRTMMTISKISSLELWLKRYPDAKVITV